MWKSWTGAALALSCIGTIVALPTTARAAQDNSSYPYQGQENFHIDGRIDKVDSERDTIVVVSDKGRAYTVDTTDAKIQLPRGGKNAETGDLVPDMRVSLDGRLLSDNILAADTLKVQPGQPGRSVDPAPPSEQPDRDPNRPSPSNHPDPSSETHAYRQQPIEMRGTVVKVDDDRGRLVLHVNDHERTIAVDDRTDLRGVPGGDADHIGVSVGDRLTVRGLLRPDGVVYANALSLGRQIDGALPGNANTDHLLVGRVSQTSNRLETRDLKVHIAGDRDVKVIVPSGIPIERDGKRISVHDLSKSDTIRVEGSYDGDEFRADRIEVLAG
ncbi:hypothetical protein CCAX7_34870 [Capsulimonas corticalis]|uniref:Uncharacterized protein n=1 Tax=Capsulimonas corticalis TaxID=2219043 RepID=A0A402CY68_9BACT|nr:DUF5666 domain-containing protein [Capsulimonas corticalis]BDI31436.1 hypothetical protein CCAX7_34870 [Capsulimonas corticalis]